MESATLIIGGERIVTYPEIHDRIARAATGLRSLGVAGGTPVAMMLRNDVALFEVSGADAGACRHDRLGQLARYARSFKGAADRRRADVLYVGHHRHAQGRTAQADEARTAGGFRAGRRHRLWHQAG